MDIQEIFDSMKATFAERNKTYGDSYRQMGPVMMAIFPNGLTIQTSDEWQRFGAFFMIICKVVRYAEAFKAGGHIDSAHDSAVYSAILEQLTREGLALRQPIEKAWYTFCVFFTKDSHLAKYYTTITTDEPSSGIAYQKASIVYGDCVDDVELSTHMKVSRVYGLTEIPFGERGPAR